MISLSDSYCPLLHESDGNRRISEHFIGRLDILDNVAGGSNIGPCSDFDTGNDAGVTSEECTFTKVDISVDATMTADLAPVADRRVVPYVTHCAD